MTAIAPTHHVGRILGRFILGKTVSEQAYYDRDLVKYAPPEGRNSFELRTPHELLAANTRTYLEYCKQNYFRNTYYTTTWAWRNI